MKIKICGITHPDDGFLAASLGADYIGILFSDLSKRKVLPVLAKEIVQAVKQEGAESIGVFVDETADQILAICEQTGIKTIQLHGIIPQQAFKYLAAQFSIIYAVSVQKNGVILSTQDVPPSAIPLYDCTSGGTGMSFDWRSFTPPQGKAWILAGGLTPQNVAEAITLLKPHGVDVSSGVEFTHVRRKDSLLVQAFIQAAKMKKETQ
jgi:phosphoribosylanthranilate isomerase